MRWESRGKNWGTNFKFQNVKAIISLIFPLWSGERLDVLGSLENAGVDWLVFRSLLKLKKVVKFSTAVLIVQNIIFENIEKSGNILIVQDSPSSCLARRLRSSAGDLLKWQKLFVWDLIERQNRLSCSVFYLLESLYMINRCASSGLRGIVRNCGEDCYVGKRRGWGQLQRTQRRAPMGRQKSWRPRQKSCGSWGRLGRKPSAKPQESRWVPGNPIIWRRVWSLLFFHVIVGCMKKQRVSGGPKAAGFSWRWRAACSRWQCLSKEQ